MAKKKKRVDVVYSTNPDYGYSYDEDEEMEEGKMKFKIIPVTVGIPDLGFVEINLPAEVSKDVKVVTNGAYMLSSERIKGELGDHD